MKTKYLAVAISEYPLTPDYLLTKEPLYRVVTFDTKDEVNEFLKSQLDCGQMWTIYEAACLQKKSRETIVVKTEWEEYRP